MTIIRNENSCQFNELNLGQFFVMFDSVCLKSGKSQYFQFGKKSVTGPVDINHKTIVGVPKRLEISIKAKAEM